MTAERRLDMGRLDVPGALGNEDSAVNESFSQIETDIERTDLEHTSLTGDGFAGRGILDYPHYTRPQSFRGWDVPETLMSGNHEEIRRWRRKKALEKTLRHRPELLCEASLNSDEQKFLKSLDEKRA